MPKFDDIDVTAQPEALNKGCLELCVGGPFFPGIEITYIATNKDLYAEPFRFKGLTPGDATKRMAVPWQADFYQCEVHWWPAQRPDDVLNHETYVKALDSYKSDAQDKQLSAALTDRIKWARGVGDKLHYDVREGERPPIPGDNDMVDKWRRLGFVVPVKTAFGEKLFVETGRSKFDGLKDRDYFYYLLNIDSYPDFLPKAKKLAEEFLHEAEKLMETPAPNGVDDSYRYFPYTYEAFNDRLDQIYATLQKDIDYDPSEDPDNIFKTREDMIERLKQTAPFNQLDGAWIRNVAKAGPIDEIGSLLFPFGWMNSVMEIQTKIMQMFIRDFWKALVSIYLRLTH